MKTLIEKEIRLLLPAFAAALLLAIIPVWLFPDDHWEPQHYSAYFFCFGIALLSLSSFGREVGLKTLPFMLAQPLNRVRIWWTKIGVLAVLVALVFDAWWLSEKLISIARPNTPNLTVTVLFFAAILFAGGLWTILVLRQVAAAFWLTILVPIVLAGAADALTGADEIALATLAIFAIAGFILAQRQFLRLQDTAWTGGVVTLGGSRIAERTAARERRPWAALFVKELHLHEFTIAGVVVLLVLHIGVIVLRKIGANMFNRSTMSVLEMFGVVWLFVPLLAGSQSVADERQLGTISDLLCLPVSKRSQFAIKFLFVFVLGGLVSPALLCGVEAIGTYIHAGAHLSSLTQWSGIFCLFWALSLIGFYASTLSQSVVQSLAAGVVATLLFWAICSAALCAVGIFGWKLWPAIAFPTLILTLLWLAYGNFRSLFESKRRWRVNIIALVVVNVLICASAAALYDRVWEYAMPLEPAHGPARLPEGKPLLVRGNGVGALSVILPDGRLWVGHFYRGNAVGKGYFAPDTDWVDVVPLERETVAIQSNGTLWASDSVGAPFVHFGAETNWESVARCYYASVILLKRDGSLWLWGTNEVNLKTYRGIRSMTPRRLGSDSDWARILHGSGWTFAWKRNGEAWLLHQPEVHENWGNVRLPGLDHIHFQSLDSFPFTSQIQIGIRDDGTLWYWRNWHFPLKPRSIPSSWLTESDIARPDLIQIGYGSTWKAVSGRFNEVVALKSDGSLWRWDLYQVHGPYITITLEKLQQPPQQLGINHDWVSLGMWDEECVAIAADGIIRLWPLPKLPRRLWSDRTWSVVSDSWLMPSRRLSGIANILDSPVSTGP